MPCYTFFLGIAILLPTLQLLWMKQYVLRSVRTRTGYMRRHAFLPHKAILPELFCECRSGQASAPNDNSYAVALRLPSTSRPCRRRRAYAPVRLSETASVNVLCTCRTFKTRASDFRRLRHRRSLNQRYTTTISYLCHFRTTASRCRAVVP